MGKVCFTEEQLSMIHSENVFEHEGKVVAVEIVWESEWEDRGKFSDKSIVFKHDNVNYIFHITRSGSYFSYYEYEYDFGGVAKEKTITKTIWVQV